MVRKGMPHLILRRVALFRRRRRRRTQCQSRSKSSSSSDQTTSLHEESSSERSSPPCSRSPSRRPIFGAGRPRVLWPRGRGGERRRGEGVDSRRAAGRRVLRWAGPLWALRWWWARPHRPTTHQNLWLKQKKCSKKKLCSGSTMMTSE